MAVSDILKGNIIDLMPVSPEDADFTLKIRNEEKLTEFIPRIITTPVKQREWITSQREKEGDYFYVITSKEGERLGTAAIYDVDKALRVCEFGRYISYGNAYANVEAAVLSLDFAFTTLDMQEIVFNNDERNKKIISFWKRFGAEFDAIYDCGAWKAARLVLKRGRYEERRDGIQALLAGRTEEEDTTKL